MKPKHTILLTLCLLCLLLLPAAAAADAVTHNGKTYTSYDQIYASTTLSSSEKLQLVQTMAGWTEELAAYMEWKNSGGLEAYQAAVNGGNNTSSDYGWNEAPGDGLGDGGTNIEPEYSYQERQAYDAAYAAYQQEFAENYAATAAYTGSGSGTQSDPYIITTSSELQEINNDLSAYYVLNANVNQLAVIGSTSAMFTGTLDGQGYTINGASMSYIDGGCIYNAGIIQNIKFKSYSQTGSVNKVIIWSSTEYSQSANINNCIFEDCKMHGRYRGALIAGASVTNPLSSIHIANIVVINCNLRVESVGTTTSRYGGFGMGGVSASPTESNKNTYQSNVVVISGALSTSGSVAYAYRIGYAQSTDNCYAVQSTVTINGNTITSSDANSYNGKDISQTESASESWWINTANYDLDTIWIWDNTLNLPRLRLPFERSIPPTISAVSVSPAVGGQETTYTLSTSATTTGQGGISGYQWYAKIGSSGSWQAISGATSATYSFVPGSYAVGDFWFKVVVTGADGGVTDSYDAGYTNVKITVVQAPQITSPAASPAEGPLTQTVTLSASVTSTAAASYQWQEQIGGTWTAISGATSATSTVSVTDSAATLHSYRLAASNVGGTAYSSTVTYQSVTPPTFSAVSASPSQGTYTSTVQLSATVSGSDSLQWQELVGSSWQNINGATSAVYSLTLTDTAATLHSYRLAATNIGGTAYSSTVTYQSVAPPVFSAFQVSPLSGGVPLSVSFSATASDTSGYRWEYSTDGTIWVQMASGASGSYTFTAEGVYYIRVIAIGTGGSTTSASATVTASVLLPEFTQISASPTSGVAPFAVTLSASATNDATFVWQMQSGSSWVQIGSGSPLTYTIPSGTSAGMVYFRAVATNQYGSTTSQTLAVEVGAAPAAEIASPAPGAVFGSNRLISFAAADAGAGVTYSWNFGDGQTGSGKTVTHSYSETGFFMVTLTTSSQFGSSEDVVRIEIVEATGDIWLAVPDISSTGASVQATVEVSPVDPGTKVWFEVLSESGTVILRSAQLPYSGPVTWEAEGLPMISGETYRVVAKSNYYGYSLPATFTLIDAVQQPHETLGTEWENGLSRDPFNVSLLVSSGIAVFGGSMGGGSVGAAVAFGVIVMFVLVGLWLRQQDVVIPLTLTLVAGWFVIGNLPGEWQPIAYTLMVVAVVAIFFYLFRKRIE